MTKVVLTSNPDSIYDDLPEKQYHFPPTYLRAVEEAKGDWAIYYESGRSGGRRVYFALARIVDIQPDPRQPDRYYAFVDEYLDFDNLVPVQHEMGYYEASLEGGRGTLNRGSVQRAVRRIREDEFDLIVRAGFAEIVGQEATTRAPTGKHVNEEVAHFERPIVEQIVRRPFRDVAFRAAVRSAYDSTCAMTGLKIINGGGRPEAEAAHIRPVHDSGPDSIRNGLSLCGTMHWMFDRGLVTVGDDYSIIPAARGVPDSIGQFLNKSRRLILPRSAALHPHVSFLRYHRERVFKG